LSVVVVTAVSAYSLMQMFAFTGFLMAGGVVASVRHKNKQERDAMRDGILSEIKAESERIDKILDAGVSGALRDELAAIRDTVGERVNDDASAREVFDAISALSLKIHGAEADEEQCRRREESIFAGIASVRAVSDIETEAALKGLEAETKRVRTLPVEERMANLRAIMDEVIGIKESSGRKFISGVSESRYEHIRRDGERDLLIRDIRDLADRIACHDEIEGERLAPILAKLNADTQFPDRLKSLRRQLRVLWGKIRGRAAETSYFRDTLRKLKNDLSAAHDVMSSGEGAALLERCDVMIGGKIIERPSFMKLYEDIAKFTYERGEEIADSMFAGRVKDVLETLGYEIVQDEIPSSGDMASTAPASLEPGAVRYLDSPYDGYRVMLKADKKGSLTARLVRVENSAGSATRSAEEQEQEDRETGRKWCRDFDAFLDRMKDMGLPMDVSLRQEPEDTKLMTVVGKGTKRREKKRKKSEEHGEGRMMSARGDRPI
jgi:hypothetical protein